MLSADSQVLKVRPLSQYLQTTPGTQGLSPGGPGRRASSWRPGSETLVLLKNWQSGNMASNMAASRFFVEEFQIVPYS